MEVFYLCGLNTIIIKQEMGMCSTQKSNYQNVSQPKRLQNSKIVSAVLTDPIQLHLFFSNIIPTISKSYGKKPKSYQLIFRASAQNYSAQKFHIASDQKRNTVLLVKTLNNSIFGAYTPCPWVKDVMYSYQQDANQFSFLFCLQAVKQSEAKQVKTEMKPKENGSEIFKIKNKQKAIMNHAQSGPIFGEGHDIFIADKCNKIQSWANLGKSYDCQYPFGSLKANRALARQDKFLVREYEVWELLF